MNLNLVFTLGLAIACGAAIYYVFQELQQEKRRVEAMSQHLRRLEGLVWTYNIRPQQDQTETEMSTVDDDDVEADDDNNDNANVIDAEPATQFPSFVFAVRSGSVPETSDVPRVEEINEESATPEVAAAQPTTERSLDDVQQNTAAIPDVVSFDVNALPTTKEDEEEDEDNATNLTTPSKRVYADTQKNRRLGRVGLPY